MFIIGSWLLKLLNKILRTRLHNRGLSTSWTGFRSSFFQYLCGSDSCCKKVFILVSTKTVSEKNTLDRQSFKLSLVTWRSLVERRPPLHFNNPFVCISQRNDRRKLSTWWKKISSAKGTSEGNLLKEISINIGTVGGKRCFHQRTSSDVKPPYANSR